LAMRTTFLLALFLSAMPQAMTPGDDPPLKMNTEEQEVVKLINAQRKLARVDELQPDAKLFQSARLHAANMAKQNKLEHDLDGKTMVDRLQATGYNLESVAENIAWNQKTPRKLIAGWMDSEDHKKNILTGDFVHIGLGMAKNDKGELYWVAVFATPLVK
jgi:uncharacterized protein YkwD